MEDILRHKKEMDKAIAMMGVAERVEDLNAAYCTAVLNYEWMRKYEREGLVVIDMSEESFIRDLNHIANYNIVRVASHTFNLAMDGELETEKCKCQLSQCLMTLKEHADMHIEKMLINDMFNTIS